MKGNLPEPICAINSHNYIVANLTETIFQKVAFRQDCNSDICSAEQGSKVPNGY